MASGLFVRGDRQLVDLDLKGLFQLWRISHPSCAAKVGIVYDFFRVAYHDVFLGYEGRC
jgi:hypothetical protein